MALFELWIKQSLNPESPLGTLLPSSIAFLSAAARGTIVDSPAGLEDAGVVAATSVF